MTTVTLAVCSREETNRRVLQAFEGEAQEPVISFESHELLWKTLTLKRWQLLQAMTGAGPMTIREAARRVKRDVKGVHGDAIALVNAGLLVKTEGGKILFPYDAIHVDFVIKAA